MGSANARIVAPATLSGTLTAPAVNGIATFSDLRVDRPGRSYTLIASVPGLLRATSDTFAVTLAFAAVSPGERHTCGITTQGEAYCWGSNAYGSLGYSPTAVDGKLAPGAVAGGLRFTSVNAGLIHTCGLTAAGAAYCWGHNGAGEIGDGTTTDRATPTQVAGGLVFAVLSTDASDDTCGLTTAGAA